MSNLKSLLVIFGEISTNSINTRGIPSIVDSVEITAREKYNRGVHGAEYNL
jgi:hypothetical protein